MVGYAADPHGSMGRGLGLSAPSPMAGASSDRDIDGGSGRIGTLRGASVQFNARRLVQISVGIVLATLVVTAAVLAVAGIHSNAQTTRLQTQGKPVTVTVTSCLGLLGGSGSNAAGYSCRGSYQLGGQTFHEALPGSTFYRPGTPLRSLAVPGDPALVSPVAIVEAQHASDDVFIVPALLAALAVALGAMVVLHVRRARTRSADGSSVTA